MAKVDRAAVSRVAEFIGSLSEENFRPLNFYSFWANGQERPALDMYPPLNHPQTINFFFAACMHQFGFWHGDRNGYAEPIIGRIGGKPAKGSDLLWKMFMLALNRDESIFTPERLARLSRDEFKTLFSDDNGFVFFPDLETRYQMTRAYGEFFYGNGEKVTAGAKEPKELLDVVNVASNPAEKLTQLLAYCPGYEYCLDNMRKKSRLLAMTMTNRPEHFIMRVSANTQWEPIVDYHLMRLALRLGMVVLDAEREETDNKKRRWVGKETEASIREETRSAVRCLIYESGKSMAFVDNVLWRGRKYCPEMETPNCAECPLQTVCEKRVELFQPVFRTTAY